MYAVIGRVEIDASRADEAQKNLEEEVIPRVKAADGFVRALWLRSTDGTKGRGVVVFDSEEHARAGAELARRQAPPPGAPVTFESAEVVEVVAEA
jgi:hypothetical protein